MTSTPRKPVASREAQGEGFLVVGRYRLKERIGRGGMGEVWIARDEELERLVAVKFVHPGLLRVPAYLERFQREMKALAKLEHPNVVRLYASGTEPQPYMVMELVRGITLREMLGTGGRIEPIVAVCYAIQIADGLGVAHRAGLQHRDIKPENILVSEDGRVWILDFGIARDTAGARRGEATDRIGTLGYMPPEMARQERTDHRADFYQLGVVLYEMLTNRKPYSGIDEASETEMQAAHACIDPDPIPALVPECPEPLWQVVERLLAKAPEHRFQKAGEIIAALGNILRNSVPHGHPLARAIQREIVRKKLHSRPPRAEELPEPAPPPSSGPRLIVTAPLDPHFAPPSPAAPSPRRTAKLRRDFVAPSPASPSARQVVPIGPARTVSLPPAHPSPPLRAPFPLAPPKRAPARPSAVSFKQGIGIALALVAIELVMVLIVRPALRGAQPSGSTPSPPAVVASAVTSSPLVVTCGAPPPPVTSAVAPARSAAPARRTGGSVPVSDIFDDPPPTRSAHERSPRHKGLLFP